MTKEEHKARHQILHAHLDELVADFLTKTGKLATKTSIMELMEWSHKQITDPE